jgi:hypothetical protein
MLTVIGILLWMGGWMRLRGHRPEAQPWHRICTPNLVQRPAFYLASAVAIWACGVAPVPALQAGVPLWLGLFFGHSAGQDMGRFWRPGWVESDAEWFSAWLPRYTLDDPMWLREAIDALHMSVVGAIRGGLAGGGWWWIGVDPERAITAGLILLLAHPVGYAIGWRTPFAAAPLLKPCDFSWGELWCGAGYGLAIITAFWR